MGYLDDNLPLGSINEPNAPWNENPEREFEVLVSLTRSKTVKIKTSNYKIRTYKDEDGQYCEEVDFSDTDLKSIVEDQVSLPVGRWHVDEFEVIPE